MQSSQELATLGLTAEHIANFWSKVEKHGPIPDKRPEIGRCWTWKASCTGSGYAKFFYGGGNHIGHRVSYIIANGPIDTGLLVDHLCYTRNCVNPAHLEAVTHRQNSENRQGAAPTNHSSGVRGVTYNARAGKWQAQVWSKQKNYYGGLFESVALAEVAATALRMKLHTHNRIDRV